MLKAAIFDVDGTLVDSVDLHARAWQEALAKFGHSVTFEQARSQIGKGRRNRARRRSPASRGRSEGRASSSGWPISGIMGRNWRNGGASCSGQNIFLWCGPSRPCRNCCSVCMTLV